MRRPLRQGDQEGREGREGGADVRDERQQARQEAEREGERDAQHPQADRGEEAGRDHGDQTAEQPGAKGLTELGHHLDGARAFCGRQEADDPPHIDARLIGHVEPDEEDHEEAADRAERRRGKSGDPSQEISPTGDPAAGLRRQGDDLTPPSRILDAPSQVPEIARKLLGHLAQLIGQPGECLPGRDSGQSPQG